jgi:hypothetical protein
MRAIAVEPVLEPVVILVVMSEISDQTAHLHSTLWLDLPHLLEN